MSLLSDSQVKLRIPTELKQRIEAEAQDAKRSMNAEI
ncbi:Arc family DNA-binding protein, partial [Acinetobacter baumannii]